VRVTLNDPKLRAASGRPSRRCRQAPTMMASIGQVSTNPALRHGNFEEAQRSGNWVRQGGGDAGMMTMEGTVDKTALLLALTAGAAAMAWQQIYTGAMGVAAVMSVTQGE
jgi:uncharacterized YccA/Bax inhibitor family protein